ncbi:MAG: hypothetical protein LBE21_05985 [Pseudomonadales bacterium]|jgi:chromosome segregation ATPase|nr:hypothetical protein [Pseudomonadales bacterium]
MANDHLDDIPSLVPERDELASHRKQRRGSGAAAAAAMPVYAGEPVARTSGFVSFVLTLLFLGMCGAGAAGYYFYTQSQAAQADFERALTRIGQLESRLNLVDEASVQSSTGLLERVDFNFSEIDKLWAARNQLRTDVAELKTALTAVQESTKGMDTAIDNHADMINQNRTQLAAVQQSIDRVTQNFAGMDNLGQQLSTINSDLKSVRSDVQSRLNATEQDIESINVFRLQVNQSLSTLQDSVNRLQERVGR